MSVLGSESAESPLIDAFRAEPRQPRWPRLWGVRARLLARGLDARLAAGEDPSRVGVLTARSTQLTSRRQRSRLATAVERLPVKASRGHGFSAAIPVDARAVEIAAPALAQLAYALHRRDQVKVRGVALTKLLLTEPSSPLYCTPDPAAVYQAAREALLAL